MIKGKTEPRIWTNPLRELDENTSLGFAFAEWCELVCKVTLLPWQKWLAVHALEITGSFETEWGFRFRKVFVLVGRQNGKSLFLELLALFFMYVLGSKLVLGTAQNLDTAEEVWDAAIDRAESNVYLSDAIERIGKVNGKKSFELKAGQKYKIAAATRKGARGKRSDLIIIDELREQVNWDGWSAVSKTMNARPNGILFGVSNAGDAHSVVLRHFRMIAHADLGDPDGIALKALDSLPEPEDSDGESIDVDDTMALFEWSAAPDADVMDKSAWAQANPSLGYGFMTERAIRSDARTDPEQVFRTEVLCQWVESLVRAPFPDGAWESTTDEEACELPDAEYFWGLDVSADRTKTALAFVARSGERSFHGEVEAYRVGWDWIYKTLAKAPKPMRVAVQGRGAPISSHIAELEQIDGVELTLCEGRDVAAWCGRLYDAIVSDDGDTLSHIPQPALDYAAQVAQTRPLGDSAWCWDRKNSETDISPLVALTMAYGLATMGATEKRIYRTAYADRGVITI